MTRVFDPTLKNLRQLVLRMGGRAEAILDKSLHAVWDRDASLAREVARDDLEIDRLDIAVDDAVLKALALQAPVAEDLREVLAVKMMANDLERVGDLARNIAKSALRLCERPPLELSASMTTLARESQQLLRRALDSYSNIDADAARAVLEADDRIDLMEGEVVRAALEQLPKHPERSSETVDLVFIAKHLERVADHATNIAEDVILVADARNVKHASKLAGGS